MACVIESGIQDKDQGPTGFDSEDGFDLEDSDSDGSSPTEACNGADDDGDGAVDEGYGDHDGDGVADCVDDACSLAEEPAGSVEVDEACAHVDYEPPAAFDDIVVEWQISGFDFLCTPVVASLTDDDGDGDLDDGDVPDILGVDYQTGELVLLSGDGAGEHWRQDFDVVPMSVAVADVDADGRPNIVTVSTALGVCAREPDGSELWCNNGATPTAYGGPTVADLDHDGVPEVIAEPLVADGRTGLTEAWPICIAAQTFSTVADLDGDGDDEILCGDEAYEHDGSLLWDLSDNPYAYAAPFDPDGDGRPGVLAADWFYGARQYDEDGSLIAEIAGGFSAACIADFDGDGAPEVGLPGTAGLTVVDSDLSLLWAATTYDASGGASCSAFDFDTDGAYELLYADEKSFWLFDGRSGDVLFEWEDHSSGTLWEYPTVADVDGDGSAEIVLALSHWDGESGVAVLGHADEAWPPVDPSWPQYVFDGAAISDAGEVRADPPTPWRGGGFVHARPPGRFDGEDWKLEVGAPQLAVAITDVCAADCEDGPISVSLSLSNASAIATDAVVVLYAEDESGSVEVGRAELALAGGERAAPLRFDFARADIGAYGWRAVVSRADGRADCDPADDEDRWSDLPCY